ncbi:MAG: VOC family protein [Pseudomonadota bacterium]|nr:VOC family protein [Pseudomonadota bacterium]
MPTIQTITPCLWFDSQAQEAATFYTGVFKNSRITQVSYYGEAGQDVHGQKPGSVMLVAFELDGQSFSALNGGPVFTFTEAISFQVNCDTQAEIDDYWDKLRAGGALEAQQCGWLKDRYGVSWQIVPRIIGELMSAVNPARSNRVMAAMMGMKKIDLAALQDAFDATS